VLAVYLAVAARRALDVLPDAVHAQGADSAAG
jgi:hypothetical protein